MIQEKDPSEDREEFKARLTDLFMGSLGLDKEENIKCLFLKDEVKISEVAQNINNAQSKIDLYLADWDAKATKSERASVVGSVTLNK